MIWILEAYYTSFLFGDGSNKPNFNLFTDKFNSFSWIFKDCVEFAKKLIPFDNCDYASYVESNALRKSVSYSNQYVHETRDNYHSQYFNKINEIFLRKFNKISWSKFCCISKNFYKSNEKRRICLIWGIFRCFVFHGRAVVDGNKMWLKKHGNSVLDINDNAIKIHRHWNNLICEVGFSLDYERRMMICGFARTANAKNQIARVVRIESRRCNQIPIPWYNWR